MASETLEEGEIGAFGSQLGIVCREWVCECSLTSNSVCRDPSRRKPALCVEVCAQLLSAACSPQHVAFVATGAFVSHSRVPTRKGTPRSHHFNEIMIDSSNFKTNT